MAFSAYRSSWLKRQPGRGQDKAVVDPSLVELLAEELRQQWRFGTRPSAEEVLKRHPEIERDGTAIDLVYEEICLREGR
jgi:hypothetical protein